jgi:hypothetical protein
MRITDEQIIKAIKGQGQSLLDERIEIERNVPKRTIAEDFDKTDNQIVEAITGRHNKGGFKPEFEREDKEKSSGNISEGWFEQGLLNREGLPAGNAKVAMILTENMKISSEKSDNVDEQIIEAITGHRNKEGFNPEFENEDEKVPNKDISESWFDDGLLNKEAMPRSAKLAMILAENFAESSEFEENLLLESILELSEGSGLRITGTIVNADTMSFNRNYYPESTLIQSVKDKVWEGGKIFFNHWNRTTGKIKELIGRIKNVFYDSLNRKLKFEAFISKAKTDPEVYKAIKDKLLDISLAAKGRVKKVKNYDIEYSLVHTIEPGASFDIIEEPPSAVGAKIEHTEEVEDF